MELEFGYGTGVQRVTVPDRNVTDVLLSNPMEHPLRGEAAVRHALAHPIGAQKLRELPRPGQKIVIVTSDISRPLPTYDVLPPVLEELDAAGIPREDITLVFALGSHRRHTEAEQRKLMGSCYGKVRCEDSDPGDCVRMGVTSRGTPVDITRRVAEADFRICLGNIEFHYFAGSAKLFVASFDVDADGCFLQLCVGHLAGDGSLPNELIQALFLRRAGYGVGGHDCRPDGLVSLLCALGVGVICSALMIGFSHSLGNHFAATVEAKGREVHRVGTHVGDVSGFIEVLSYGHGGCHREAYFSG